jgi:aryl-alcohol dehydrogenase-like predicted oxidoreductase
MDVFRTAAKVDAVQPPYNLFEREIEADVLPYAATQGLYRSELWCAVPRAAQWKDERNQRFTRGDLRKVDPKFQGERFRRYLTAVDELGRFARERFGKSVLALAVHWVLDRGQTIALWGARHPAQLDPVGDIGGWHIDAVGMREIDAILERCIPEPISPAFMAPPQAPSATRMRRRA